jgi:hypothetical protein
MRLGGGIQYSGFSNGVWYVLGWCCVFVTMLPDTIDDSSTSTRGLYLRSSQRCLIKRIRDFKEVSYLYSAGRAIHGQAGQSGGGGGDLARRSGIQIDTLYSVRHLKQCIRNFLKSNAHAHTCPHMPSEGDLLVQAGALEHSRHSSS